MINGILPLILITVMSGAQLFAQSLAGQVEPVMLLIMCIGLIGILFTKASIQSSIHITSVREWLECNQESME